MENSHSVRVTSFLSMRKTLATAMVVLASSLFSTSVLADITAPAGSSFSGSSTEFSWSIPASSTQLRFRVGLIAGSIGSIYDSEDDPAFDDSTNAVSVNGLPNDGSQVRVRLDWTNSGNQREVKVYTNTIAGSDGDDMGGDGTDGGGMGGDGADDGEGGSVESSITDLLADLGCAPGQRIQSTSNESWACVNAPAPACPAAVTHLFFASGFLGEDNSPSSTGPFQFPATCGWSRDIPAETSGATGTLTRELLIHYPFQFGDGNGSDINYHLSAGNYLTDRDLSETNAFDVYNSDTQIIDACAILIGCPTLAEYEESIEDIDF